MSPEHFDALDRDMLASLEGEELFVQDCLRRRDPQYRLPIRVVNEHAWHSLFARNLFIVDPPSRPPPRAGVHGYRFAELQGRPRGTARALTSLIAAQLREAPGADRRHALRGRDEEVDLLALNYLLPLRGVLPMHCSANVGQAGDVALFFGLSGTGKTTLSSDPERRLIGDDEHGWSDRGVFNFEGGCYAKTIRLSREAEPQIYATTRRFGTVLENVVVDAERAAPDLDDDRFTENTRAAYPISFIDNAVPRAGGHPRNIVLLTADAFGVLPPSARLTPEARCITSCRVHRQSGRHREGRHRAEGDLQHLFRRPVPAAAARPLRADAGRTDRATRRAVWLVNTGWTGGAYGAGSRMKIQLHAGDDPGRAVGRARRGRYERDPVFNLDIPAGCPGCPGRVLHPRETWTDPARLRSSGSEARADVRGELQDLRRGCEPGRVRGRADGLSICDLRLNHRRVYS